MSEGPTIEGLDAFRARARAWLADNLPRRDGPELRSSDLTPEQVERARGLQRRMHEAGFVGITVPIAYGGQGLTVAHERAWAEESAGYALPLPGGIASSVSLGIVLPTLLQHASEEQKRMWVPELLRGTEIWVQLLSEPGAGSDLASLLTRATRDGDTWVLNGTKVWSSGAMHADFGICLARTNWDVPKHRGLTWFKVPLRDPAVTVRPIREINGSSEFCEEFLDDVRVDADMVIGDVDGGWPIANFMLAVERGAAGGEGAGGRRAARSFAPDLVELAEGRGVARDPAVRQLIARAAIDDWIQGQLTRRTVASIAAGSADATAASLVKLNLGITQPERAALAMEVAGRRALAWTAEGGPGHAAAIGFLNGRIMSIAGGSNEIQRNIIGERLLGLPREPAADRDRSFRDVLRDATSWGRSGAS
jgi:alkylation response protein AidB-like acyl-CoA dehydrogenase